MTARMTRTAAVAVVPSLVVLFLLPASAFAGGGLGKSVTQPFGSGAVSGTVKMTWSDQWALPGDRINLEVNVQSTGTAEYCPSSVKIFKGYANLVGAVPAKAYVLEKPSVWYVSLPTPVDGMGVDRCLQQGEISSMNIELEVPSGSVQPNHNYGADGYINYLGYSGEVPAPGIYIDNHPPGPPSNKPTLSVKGSSQTTADQVIIKTRVSNKTKKDADRSRLCSIEDALYLGTGLLDHVSIKSRKLSTGTCAEVGGLKAGERKTVVWTFKRTTSEPIPSEVYGLFEARAKKFKKTRVQIQVGP